MLSLFNKLLKPELRNEHKNQSLAYLLEHIPHLCM